MKLNGQTYFLAPLLPAPDPDSLATMFEYVRTGPDLAFCVTKIESWPLSHVFPPLTDRPPSQLVVAWRGTTANPLIRSFVQIAVASYRSAARSPA
jgi:hypothetical protein